MGVESTVRERGKKKWRWTYFIFSFVKKFFDYIWCDIGDIFAARGAGKPGYRRYCMPSVMY